MLILCAAVAAMSVCTEASGRPSGLSCEVWDTSVTARDVSMERPEVLDSSVTGALGRKLDEYTAVLEREPVETKCGEADFLIESCTDSLIRQFTAIRLYGHYVSSKLMGDEAVAIHIFDRWFATGEVRMRNELDLMNARIFAEFNRQSLIGNKAPELALEDISGKREVIFGDGSYSDRVSVLFFYDSGCPTCRMDAILLRNVLGDGRYRLNLYAVYTQQSRQDWESFADEYLDIENPEVRVRHFHDPEVQSDFQRKYGVLQTPMIFLVSRDGTVIGRHLDVPALVQLLDIYCKPYVYGNEESEAFFDRVFAKYGGNPDCDTVKGICDSIAVRTIGVRDTLIFKQMTGDLMYWLGANRGEGVKCGLEYLTDRYIDGMPDVWDAPEDSLGILPYAGLLGDLLGKAATGGKLPPIEVQGTLKVRGKDRTVSIRLDRLRNATVIFHTEGCAFCEAELSAADSISLADRKARFFIVDIDAVLDTSPETACSLFDAVDLSVLPYITTVDRKGRIARKYVSLLQGRYQASGRT